MLYLTQDVVRAESDYRRERITADFRKASRWSLRLRRRNQAKHAASRDWQLAA